MFHERYFAECLVPYTADSILDMHVRIGSFKVYTSFEYPDSDDIEYQITTMFAIFRKDFMYICMCLRL